MVDISTIEWPPINLWKYIFQMLCYILGSLELFFSHCDIL